MNEINAWSYEVLHRAAERARERDPNVGHRRDVRRVGRAARSSR